jgi:hypothetical protein
MSVFFKRPRSKGPLGAVPFKSERVVVFLLRPVTSYTAYVFFRKLGLPLIGLSGTLSSEQLLWQNANVLATDLNTQYLVLALYWSLLSKRMG